MSEVKKEETPVTPNTMNLEDLLTEEQKIQLQATKEWDTQAAADNLLIRYENFGKSKVERDKMWEAWANTFKSDASSILKGIIPEPRLGEGQVERPDLTKIEDEKVRIEIIRLWMEQRSGKKFTTNKEVR